MLCDFSPTGIKENSFHHPESKAYRVGQGRTIQNEKQFALQLCVYSDSFVSLQYAESTNVSTNLPKDLLEYNLLITFYEVTRKSNGTLTLLQLTLFGLVTVGNVVPGLCWPMEVLLLRAIFNICLNCSFYSFYICVN